MNYDLSGYHKVDILVIKAIDPLIQTFKGFLYGGSGIELSSGHYLPEIVLARQTLKDAYMDYVC